MIKVGLDNLITKLLKKWMSKWNSGRPITRTCAGLINERRDRLKASVLLNSGHFER